MSDISITLTEKCIMCSGTGNHNEWGKPGQQRGHTRFPEKGETIVFSVEEGCRHCDGTGETLTGIAEQILWLVRNRLDRKAAPVPPIE